MLTSFMSSPHRQAGSSVQPGANNRSNADIGLASFQLSRSHILDLLLQRTSPHFVHQHRHGYQTTMKSRGRRS